MLRRFMMSLLVLSAAGSDGLAENYSGSFLRKGQKINLIAHTESLVQGFPPNVGCEEDWKFVGSEREGAVIEVNSERFPRASGFFSPHRLFGDFVAEFEVEDRSMRHLHFAYGVGRAGGATFNSVSFDPATFGQTVLRRGIQPQTTRRPTREDLNKVDGNRETWNQISIRYVGTQLTVSMNDVEIASHTVPAGTFGAVGVFAKGPARMKSRMMVTSLTDPKEFPQVPVVGKGILNRDPRMRLFDLVVLQEMARMRASAASVTRISHTSRTTWNHDFTRSYGWMSNKKEQAVPLDVMIGTATAARFPYNCTWELLFQTTPLSRKTTYGEIVGKSFDEERFGPISSPKVLSVNLGHLVLERTGFPPQSGWPIRLAKEKGIELKSPMDWLCMNLTIPLQNDPGTHKHTAYHAEAQLMVMEAATGKPVRVCMEETIFKKYGIDSIELIPRDLPYLLPRDEYEHDPRLVANARFPSCSSASSYALAVLMANHTPEGRPRARGDLGGDHYSIGSLPNSCCMLAYHGRVNWAIVFNGRGDASRVHDRLLTAFRQGIGTKFLPGCFLYRQKNQQMAAEFLARRKLGRGK